ncbi:unnamed protein product [Cochlearia groenlandica]
MYAKQILEKFDKNKDGKLSLEEFTEAAIALYNKFSREEAVKMFKEFDVDGDGEIDGVEFTSCVEKMLKEVFNYCDVDGDGKIPTDELYVSMTKLGKECTKESCVEKVRAADNDGDGYLSFDEFVAMVISDL